MALTVLGCIAVELTAEWMEERVVELTVSD